MDYAFHVRRDEGDYSVSQNFMDNGIVVLDPKKDCSAQGTLGFLKNVLHEKLLQSNQGMDYLKHIIKKQSNHPGRTWKQLYPSTGGDRIRKLPWTKTISGLRLFLEKCILPDLYFARMAYIEICTIKKDNIDHEKTMVNGFLQLWNVNALARSDDVTQPQMAHIDGTGINLICIIIENCGDDGYKFECVPKSHNLLEEHDTTKKLPLAAMKKYAIQRGMLLVFAETLIHAGGVSSMTSDEYHDKYKDQDPPQINYFKKGNSNKYPTDLSFQFTFQHIIAPIMSYPGFAKPLWYKDQETNIDTDASDFSQYITRVNGNYNDKIARLFKDYVRKVRGFDSERNIYPRRCKRVKNY